MVNLFNELTVKIGEWDSKIAFYKNEYTNAQSEIERNDAKDELSKIYGELSQGVSEIEGNISKIKNVLNHYDEMGKKSEYAKKALESQKAEIKKIIEYIWQLEQLKKELNEFKDKCNLEGGDDKPKVKSIW